MPEPSRKFSKTIDAIVAFVGILGIVAIADIIIKGLQGANMLFQLILWIIVTVAAFTALVLIRRERRRYVKKNEG